MSRDLVSQIVTAARLCATRRHGVRKRTTAHARDCHNLRCANASPTSVSSSKYPPIIAYITALATASPMPHTHTDKEH